MASTFRQRFQALTYRLAIFSSFSSFSSLQATNLRSFTSRCPIFAQGNTGGRPGPSTSGDLKARRPLADTSKGEIPVAQAPKSTRQESMSEALSETNTTNSLPKMGSSGTPIRISSHDAQPIKIDDFSLSTFPQFLYKAHPLLDSGKYIEVAPEKGAPFGASVHLYGSEKVFEPRPPSASSMVLEAAAEAGEGEDQSSHYAILEQITPYTRNYVKNLRRHTLSVDRVVRMTGKGKLARFAVLVVAGDGNGNVGFARGKDENVSKAGGKAFRAAVQSLERVDRFENRTVQRSMTGEWGATKVHLRPRPPGFGLRCPPAVHAVARAAGITDLSASISGSTNSLNVCRAVLSILCGGANPIAFGDGIGGSARRRDLGEGMKGIEELEIERGRRFRILGGVKV